MNCNNNNVAAIEGWGNPFTDTDAVEFLDASPKTPTLTSVATTPEDASTITVPTPLVFLPSPVDDLTDGIESGDVKTRIGLFEQLANIVISGTNSRESVGVETTDERKSEKCGDPSSENAEVEVVSDDVSGDVSEEVEDSFMPLSQYPADDFNEIEQHMETDADGGDQVVVKQVEAFWRLVESKSDHEIGDSTFAENEGDCDAEECASNCGEDVVATPEVVDLALMNANNNNVDAESRFNDFIDGGSDNGFHAYQPSAISAQAERPAPYSRYIPPSPQYRVGGDGIPGAPAATEGGRFSRLPADKAGVPWGGRKQRIPPKKKFINQEPYQTLKPSGQWTYATQMRQPANKQAQADRTDPFPRYIAQKQQCKARPEYRKKTTDQGVATSCKAPIKQKRRRPINLDAVRCNCPGLYPQLSSHGPGNYWDEEDDDEAIVAGMCAPEDEFLECGQGVDDVFPLEEWSDEWEDGITSGDCLKGKLAPGTLELLPWENPCLEELYKRKARIQELRNKRWAALDKARAEARKLKEKKDRVNFGNPIHKASWLADEEEKNKLQAKELERKALNEYGQKSWSILSWFTPTSWASAPANPHSDPPETNRPGKTCTGRTSTGPNVCISGGPNTSCNNSVDGLVPEAESSRVEANQEFENYEWDQAEESGDEYNERINRKIRIAETIIRCERLRGLERKSENNAASIEQNVAKSSGGIWSYLGFSSSSSNGNNNNADIQEFDPAIDNTNNNAANRCFRPCPPCPQENCAPPPFECPCNDIHCPKKLKPNKDNTQKKKGCGVAGAVGDVSICLDVTDDMQIDGIDITVKKPPPDLANGCPCGDDDCKKRKCNPQPKKYSICEPSKGKMALQEACPVQECEVDICDKASNEPKECPCNGDDCPKKGGSEGFVFLYPPSDKIKYDDNGCPLQQQMHCVVTQIGGGPPKVAVKPVGGKPLHCDPVPPCPCPEYEKLERGGCLCSGNAWGEEIDDETNTDCSTPPPKKETKSKDCGSATGSGVQADDFEWDFWDSPCGDDIAKNGENVLPEDMKKCQEFMAKRKDGTDNKAAAVQAALEAFEADKVKKEREKVEAETRKRRIAELREAGLSEEEIVDQLCSNRVPGPCEIMGEFPPQAACAPNPPPPGCPCPDPACPKRAPFDYQMHDTDLAKIKNPYDYKNTDKYLKSTAYKTMDCELKRPTYKDITKSYPKRPRNKCPCPECVGDAKKAWAEVEKLKVGPPPECPCKDPKCPKKPVKEVKKEVEEAEDLGQCAMKTYYPRQSGCAEVLRCDLILNPCGENDECGPIKKPEERYRCHVCSIRKPMPKQEACPDYDCHDCRLVCHKCACRPKKCDKCEDASKLRKEKPAEVPHEECPPCTVKGPLPIQSGCAKIEPCDDQHPCMCDPNTGEPIEPERCGPCDTKNHDFFPPQGGCNYAVAVADRCASNESDEVENQLEKAQDNVGESEMNENHEIIDLSSDDVSYGTDPWDDVESPNIETSIVKQPESIPEPIEDKDDEQAVEVSQEVVLAEDASVPFSCVDETPESDVEALEVPTANPTELPLKLEEENTTEEKTSEESSILSQAPIVVVEEQEAVISSDEPNNPEQPEETIVPEETETSAPVVFKEEAPSKVSEKPELAKVVAEEPIEEAAAEYVDVKKGTTANVKVEFRVVGLELTDAQLKQVNEAFERQEAGEAAVRKDVLEDRLKKAALEAVKEKMKLTSTLHEDEKPAAVEQNPQPEDVVATNNASQDLDNQTDEDCDKSSSFLGISAIIPAFMRPKAKCRSTAETREQNPLVAARSSTSSSSSFEAKDGLNAISELDTTDDWQQKGIIHRTSFIAKVGRTDEAMDAETKIKAGIVANLTAKRRGLVLVNNDLGAIGLVNLDRLSEQNQEAIKRKMGTA